MIAFSAGGFECVPNLSGYYPSLEECEDFDPEICQALLDKTKEQKLKIQVRHVLTYVEGTDEVEMPEGWTEEEYFGEFGLAFTLSSNGKKFVIKE